MNTTKNQTEARTCIIIYNNETLYKIIIIINTKTQNGLNKNLQNQYVTESSPVTNYKKNIYIYINFHFPASSFKFLNAEVLLYCSLFIINIYTNILFVI